MKLKIKQRAKLAAIAVGCIFTLCFFVDYLEFKNIDNGNYSTPWYSNNILKDPYICFRVFASDSTTYHWTKNAAGDDWQVKETVINKKTWWTIINKVEHSYQPPSKKPPLVVE